MSELPDEPVDASDPVQERERRSKAKRIERRLHDVTRGLMSVQDAREWLWFLMADLMLTDKQVLMGDSAYAQGFHDGQREVGLRMMRQCAKADPENFVLMLKEHDH